MGDGADVAVVRDYAPDTNSSAERRALVQANVEAFN